MSQVVDNLLKDRLCPTEEQPLKDDCLEGTRLDVLSKTRKWLQDYDSTNILWIVGAPGAGKSTIATTIAREFSAPCARFFCDRDQPNLRDPRLIWRTIAYNLAANHDNVKAALRQALETGKPKDYLVKNQFEKLIKEPLGTMQRETAYAVVVIDALDECDSVNGADWKSLLDSLACWSTLPPYFKLVVTSRDLHGIRDTLGGVSYPIDLTTGDNVSEDSKSDIRRFFEKKFEEIGKGFQSLSGWPGDTLIEELTDYARGLFIWAIMVVGYVGQRTGGWNPVKRLKDVLSDIKPQSGYQGGKRKELDGHDRVDRLYARIVFEAFRNSTSDEREVARSILAAVVLAKEPLRICDLAGLLSTSTSDPDELLTSIKSTLEELSPIIPVSRGADNRLRVFHKTVSDFFLSHERSFAAFESLKNGILQTPDGRASVFDSHSFILDLEKDNRTLALTCVHLACRSFSLDIHSIPGLLKHSNGPLDYAHQHWFEHLEDAGGSRIPNLKCLADAMKFAYGRLQRYAPQMMLAKEEAVALIASLRDAAAFASQCINGASNGNLFCSSEENGHLIFGSLTYRASHR